MSLCELGYFGVGNKQARTEELAIVPDIHQYLNMLSDSQLSKNYNDCSVNKDTEEELLGQNEPLVKRPCNGYHHSNHYQSSNCNNAAGSYFFGPNFPATLPPASSLDFAPSSNKVSSPYCEQIIESKPSPAINLLPDMQPSQVLLSHEQSIQHSSNDYKLVIKEQPEEVISEY